MRRFVWDRGAEIGLERKGQLCRFLRTDLGAEFAVRRKAAQTAFCFSRVS